MLQSSGQVIYTIRFSCQCFFFFFLHSTRVTSLKHQKLHKKKKNNNHKFCSLCKKTDNILEKLLLSATVSLGIFFFKRSLTGFFFFFFIFNKHSAQTCLRLQLCLDLWAKFTIVYVLTRLIHGSFKENPLPRCYRRWCKVCKHSPSSWSVWRVFPGRPCPSISCLFNLQPTTRCKVWRNIRSDGNAIIKWTLMAIWECLEIRAGLYIMLSLFFLRLWWPHAGSLERKCCYCCNPTAITLWTVCASIDLKKKNML